jgi:hypothetical protein
VDKGTSSRLFWYWSYPVEAVDPRLEPGVPGLALRRKRLPRRLRRGEVSEPGEGERDGERFGERQPSARGKFVHLEEGRGSFATATKKGQLKECVVEPRE